METSINLSSLNCDGLCSFLKSKNLSDDVITVIKDQEIDGETFLSLDNEDIGKLFSKMGVIKKLKQLQLLSQSQSQSHSQTSQDFSGSYIMVKYEGKSYCLSNVPSKGDVVVTSTKKQMEEQLRLHELGKDFSTLGKFVRIAHYGVTGHCDLEMKVRESLRSVFELCHDTVHTLNDFKRNSQEALESLQTAYRYLSEALEDPALKILVDLQEISKKMGEKASNLSQKCKEQSKTIKEVGDTTLKKKHEVNKEKQENISKIKELQGTQEQTNDDMKDADSEKKAAQSNLQANNRKEEEARDQFIKAIEDNEKKFEEFRIELRERRDNITSDYRKQIEKAEEKYLSKKEEIENTYLKQIEENKKSFEDSSTAATQEYEAMLVKNNDHLTNKVSDNEKWLSAEKKRIREMYEEIISEKCKVANEKIREIENDHREEVRRIDKKLSDELKSNGETLEARLKENQEVLNLSLTGNDEETKARKGKTWFWQYNVRSEEASSKAQKDVNAKKAKAEADKAAKDDKISRDDTARTNYRSEMQQADNSKENNLEPYRKERDRKTQSALDDQGEDVKKAETEKDLLDKDAQRQKENANATTKNQKNEKILKAEKDMQTANNEAFNAKIMSNKEAKSTKEKTVENLEENYKLELKRLDKEEEDFKSQLKMKLEPYETKIKSIKEKELRNQELIDKSKEDKKQAQKQMREVIQQITQCKSRTEIHDVTEKSLKEAIGALNQIETIMANVGNFWKGVEGLCEKVTGRSLKKQVDIIHHLDPQERKFIWQSEAFKVEALNFYGKWIALKEVCTMAGENVNFALDEVRHYMVECPSEDEAFASIQGMAGKFLQQLQEDTD